MLSTKMYVSTPATMAEWFQSKLAYFSELSNIEEKKNVLSEIKIKLGSLDSRETEEISCNVELGTLFTQLTSNDREYVVQVCDVLFGILKPGELYHRYSAELCKLLNHSDAAVRSLVLHEILAIACNPQKISMILTNVNLLVAVISRIGDDSLMVSKCAMSIMKEVGQHPDGLQILYTGELLRNFARLLAKNYVIGYRVYEVVVDVAKSSKEGLEASARSGFLDSLLNILESDDILLRMNALEILTELALTVEGLKYLEHKEVLSQLAQKIAMADLNPLPNLMIPILMKFFGNVARHWPNEIFSKYPEVVSALFQAIEAEDHTILGVALETLGYVAAHPEGKYALEDLNNGDTMSYALKRIAVVIQTMPTELRIRALNSLAFILDVPKAEQDNRILSLTKSWFDCMSSDPLRMIVEICRQPFADIRQAGLEVLAALASQAWGQEYIFFYPGLVEFLLDRNIESFKECKEAKYEVVKRMVDCGEDMIDLPTMERFKQFVNQGPYYIEINTGVAVEGGL